MSTVVVLVSHPVGQGRRNVVVRVNVTLDLAGSGLGLRDEAQVGSGETLVLIVWVSQADQVCAGSVEVVLVTLLVSHADQVCAGSIDDEVVDVDFCEADHGCPELLEYGVVVVLFSQADQVFAAPTEDDFVVLDDQFFQSLVAELVVEVVDFSLLDQLNQCDSTLDEMIDELDRSVELEEEGVVYGLVVKLELVGTPWLDDLEMVVREDVVLATSELELEAEVVVRELDRLSLLVVVSE